MHLIFDVQFPMFKLWCLFPTLISTSVTIGPSLPPNLLAHAFPLICCACSDVCICCVFSTLPHTCRVSNSFCNFDADAREFCVFTPDFWSSSTLINLQERIFMTNHLTLFPIFIVTFAHVAWCDAPLTLSTTMLSFPFLLLVWLHHIRWSNLFMMTRTYAGQPVWSATVPNLNLEHKLRACLRQFIFDAYHLKGWGIKALIYLQQIPCSNIALFCNEERLEGQI